MARLYDLFRPKSNAKTRPASESAAALRAILNQAVVPMFALNRVGEVAIWNQACEQLTGLRAEQVLGTKDHWKGFYLEARTCLADLVFKGAGGDVAKFYVAHDAGGASQGSLRAQNWCDLPNGKRRYLQIDAGPVRDADGAIAFVVETLQDYTALVEAQAAVEKARAAQAQDFEAIRTMLGGALARLADGDLSARIETHLPAAADALRKDFNAAAEALADLVARASQSSEAIDRGAQGIVAATQEVSEQSAGQREQLAETARSLSRITQTVRENAQGADKARAIVAGAKADAEKSGSVVREAIAAIHEIELSSKQIGQIIGVIDEIAFQTNLLALNAGVEAARAGDLGRGFAVVASEVRALAQRSADAAKEIKTLISKSNAQVSRGVALVGDAGASLTQIARQVANLNDAVAAIASHSLGQADSLQQVDAAMGQVDRVMQQTMGIVDNTSSAASSLADEMARLQYTIGRFRFDRNASVARKRMQAAE